MMKTPGEIAADEKTEDEDEKLFSPFTSFFNPLLKTSHCCSCLSHHTSYCSASMAECAIIPSK
jgi:hypothetical protein